MLVFYFVIWLIYFMLVFCMERMRLYMLFLQGAYGMILILNDFDNIIVPDSTLKLSFLLSVVLVTFMLIAYVNYVEDNNIKNGGQ